MEANILWHIAAPPLFSNGRISGDKYTKLSLFAKTSTDRRCKLGERVHSQTAYASKVKGESATGIIDSCRQADFPVPMHPS